MSEREPSNGEALAGCGCLVVLGLIAVVAFGFFQAVGAAFAGACL